MTSRTYSITLFGLVPAVQKCHHQLFYQPGIIMQRFQYRLKYQVKSLGNGGTRQTSHFHSEYPSSWLILSAPPPSICLSTCSDLMNRFDTLSPCQGLRCWTYRNQPHIVLPLLPSLFTFLSISHCCLTGIQAALKKNVKHLYVLLSY